MKSKFLKLSALSILAMSLLIISCDNEDGEMINADSISAEDVVALEEVDLVVDELNTTVEQAFVEQEVGLTFSRGGETYTSYFPDCLTKTVTLTDSTITVTLDFGEGCMVRNHFMAGVLTMSFEKNPELMTKTINVTFDGYKIDNKLIEGSKTIVRVKENENGNPQSTATFDIMVTWDNGDTATRVGEKVREWVEGKGSGTWGDNVYLITGHWATIRKNGVEITGVVTTALRRELSCKFLVSGVLELTKDETSASLDFGDGECDNKALLTLEDGTEIEITLD